FIVTNMSSCFQLYINANDLTQPLCSITITVTSTLIRVAPPQCIASVLSASLFWQFDLSFYINTLVPAVP
ncbi:hypothetical protein O6C51_06080, partial [Legionella pneumophila]